MHRCAYLGSTHRDPTRSRLAWRLRSPMQQQPGPQVHHHSGRTWRTVGQPLCAVKAQMNGSLIGLPPGPPGSQKNAVKNQPDVYQSGPLKVHQDPMRKGASRQRRQHGLQPAPKHATHALHADRRRAAHAEWAFGSGFRRDGTPRCRWCRRSRSCFSPPHRSSSAVLHWRSSPDHIPGRH
jgi:hypothetical protein